MKCYNPGLRQIRRGGWQALFYWLVNTVLVNSYLLSFYSPVDKSLKFTDQIAFRTALVRALLDTGGRVQDKRKRSNTHTNTEGSTIPVHQHELEHRGRKGDCMNCKGERYRDPLRKRVVL